MAEKKQKEDQLTPDETTWTETPWLGLKGFLMGTADIIPGVSGGTMALITGIYDRLINAIRSVDKNALESLFKLNFRTLLQILHWKFILILLGGIITAVFFFTRVLPLQVYMYTHPEVIYGLFFGLIVGSIFVLLKEVDREKRDLKTFTPLVIGTLVGFWVVTLVPAETPETFWFVFLSGLIVFCALILPGVSGSYLLLILGKYDYVLFQLAELGGERTTEALLALFPLFLGGAISLALISRVLSWLLQNYHTITLMVLIGFLIGSLYVIWPWQEREYEEEIARTEIHRVTDSAVQELKADPPDTDRPTYRRLGDVLNPETEKDEWQIEIHTVERNLVESEPFVPGLAEKEPLKYNLWGGITGLLCGMILVGGLDHLRRKK